VSDVFKESVELISESEHFPSIVEKMANSTHSFFYIVDDNQEIQGSISLNEIRQTIVDYENLKHLLIARDIMNPEVIRVYLDENLDEVMRKFGRYNIDEFPVISTENGNRIIGTVWQQDVIETYNRQIFLRDMSGEIGFGIKKTMKQKIVPVFEKYHLFEIEAPNIFVGKTLKEIDLRTQYGGDILLVKKEKKGRSFTVQPDANYKIEVGDALLVFGEKKHLEILEKI